MLTQEQLAAYFEGQLAADERLQLERLLADDAAAQSTLADQQNVHLALDVLLGSAPAHERVKQSIFMVLRGASVEQLTAQVMAETRGKQAVRSRSPGQPLRQRLKSWITGSRAAKPAESRTAPATVARTHPWLRPAMAYVSAAAVLAFGLFFYQRSVPRTLVQIGEFTGVVGEPIIQHARTRSATAIQRATPVHHGDQIATGDADRAEIQFLDGTTLRLGFNTVVELAEDRGQRSTSNAQFSRPSEVRLLAGQVWTKVQTLTTAPDYAIRTDVATAVARGTEFGVKLQRSIVGTQMPNPQSAMGRQKPEGRRQKSEVADPQRSTFNAVPADLLAVLTVKEGTVDFFNPFGTVQATAMTESTASAASAPTPPVTLQTIKQFSLEPGVEWNFDLPDPFDLRPWVYQTVYPQGWAGFYLRALADPEDGVTPQLRVVRVWPGSPAAQTGLAVGDVITQLDGQTTTNIQEVLAAVSRQPGASVSLNISRHGTAHVVSLQTTSHPFALPFTDVPVEVAEDLFVETWPMIYLLAAQRSITCPEWHPVAEQLEAFLNRHPDIPAIHNNLGLWYDFHNQVDLTIRHLGRAVAIQPDHPLYRYNLARALTSIGNLERTVEEAEAVPQLAPDWIPGSLLLSDVYLVMDRHEEALAILEQGLSVHALSPDLWGTKFLALLNLERLDEALAAAMRAVELEPSFAEWWSRLGVVHSVRGDKAQAEAAVRKAIELDPGLSTAYNSLAIKMMQKLSASDSLPSDPIDASPEELAIERWQNRPPEELAIIDEAEHLVRKAIDLGPVQGSYHHTLGNILLARGAVDEAEAALAKAIELDPDAQEAAARNSLAYFLALWGIRLDEALELARHAVQRAPKGYAYNTLATVHFRRGEWVEAETAWKQCIALGGPTGDPEEAWFRLGRVYEQMHRAAAAAEAFEEALRLRPDFPKAAEALERLGQP